MATSSSQGTLEHRHEPAAPPWRGRLRASAYNLVPNWSWLAGGGALSGLLRLCRVDVFGRLFACRATADATNFALTVLPVGVLLSTADIVPALRRSDAHALHDLAAETRVSAVGDREGRR